MDQFTKKVKQFHDAMGLPIAEEQTVTNKEVNKRRVSLLKEELKELEDALTSNDKKETLDALCDLQFVLSGAVLELGFQKVFEKGFTAVSASNMTKAFNSESEAQSAIDNALNNRNTILTMVETVDGSWITKNAIGKLIKNPAYTSVDLSGFITDD